MNTAYASAERKSGPDLQVQVDFVCKNPVIDGLMQSVGGLVAVLNEERQILALNTHLLNWMGVSNPDSLLGLRPGEVLLCKHAHKEPGGCGTSEFCRTCGAAIAIVTSLVTNQPVERTCALSVQREQGSKDLFLRVQANPLTFNGQKLVLLFLQDITHQHRLAALERVFFHDIRNLLGGLTGVCEVLELSPDHDEMKSLALRALRISRHLAREIDIQDTLSRSLQNHAGEGALSSNSYATKEKCTTQKVFHELQDLFAHHPLNSNGRIVFQEISGPVSFSSDPIFLVRILSNMITNALEAGADSDPVNVWCEVEPGFLNFRVWNPQAIPDEVTLRIFQRHFSTKKEFGRGIGTYSMKLFAEEALGGSVDFTTTAEKGTTFRLRLPL